MFSQIAFNIGPIPIHWYGIILATGAVAGLLLAIQEGKRFNIKPEFFMDLLLYGAVVAIICARIYYVAFQWDQYKDQPLKIFAIWEGGIAIYGALIGAVIAAVFLTRSRGYSFWRIADIAAPGLFAGQLIGRWGNFVNQEAYGGPVSEAFLRDKLHLPDFIVNRMFIQGEYHHPTFLYESVWNLVGLLLIILWLRRRSFVRAGEVFMSYLIWYSIGRFFIEGLRTDSLSFTGPDWLASFMNILWSPMELVFEWGAMTYGGNIRISQLVGILIIVACIIIIVVRRQTGAARERYLDPITSTKGY
ncbi:prolipoprotein diacylglyceryl transferase [Paenibacillus albiflavus]|uniref:Phosphatidylglycerol--prolipoprotein diacylglyceryl transferase n=1 Tax=Paenibacillus albiflavus TaxID=2545760 RepID=A0A4R4E2N7_9BACL|nr:prolipoprotein diacylglyceryl transferase [Paenibacillus albiflavus]TCZ72870.1 prolipoprotein diacylglyceryl transferase [Paenibacillus albiflavus]